MVETEQQCIWEVKISLKLTQDINTVRQSSNIFMYTETSFFFLEIKSKKNQPNKLVVSRPICDYRVTRNFVEPHLQHVPPNITKVTKEMQVFLSGFLVY